MKFKDYYEILGVKRDASVDEIRRAYRRLARKLHPDVSKEADAEARFKTMKEAYEVLKDPEKRKAYDQFGANWKDGQDFQPPPRWRQPAGSRASASGNEDFSDFFESLFGGGHSGFTGARGGRMNGEDINAQITIPIEDAYNGASRQLTLDVPQADVGGRKTTRRRTLNVSIPKGVMAGQRIRLEKQGAAGRGEGARPGDLYLQVAFEPHAVFEARGRDIHVALPITPWEAALGRTVKAPTLGGPVDLKIPAGSSSGKRLRLKGRGLPGQTAGDQFVELVITVPGDVDPKARELYEQLERDHAYNPRAALGV